MLLPKVSRVVRSLVLLLATILVLSDFAAGIAAAKQEKLTLIARSRREVPESGGKFTVVYRKLEWEPRQTALIVCDMWDQHWCKGATRRVTQLAPRMNEVVAKARKKGLLIIHAPSGTVNYYESHPARKRAQNAPTAANLPEGIDKWCKWIDEKERKVGYPIDHSDGGCDCEPKCEQGSPWRKQIATIEISNDDAISDSGIEIWNLLQQRSIDNVILMGVHTNMCVLGRPFGLRNMARFGKKVVLMRDMTDTMYNSRAHPYVSHFTGTDFIIEHVEELVCPTVMSTVFTGRPEFRFKNDKRPRVVFISAESEYNAAVTLPEFAHELEMKYGLCCEILQSSTDQRSNERHDIWGMEALGSADLAVLFVRRRAFPVQQMQYLHDYLNSGKPLIALRTSSHAFDTRATAPQGHVEWKRFDPDVLGGNYHGHYGSGPTTIVTIAAGAEGHPVLAGLDVPFTSNAALYRTGPLSKTAKLLLTGKIPEKEPEPLAWTNTYKNARIFYMSLGHADDFENRQFRRLFINAVFWAMDKPVPKVKNLTAARVTK
jgi:nicotinamidase-related amidase/type 1 glutamine amidotransferase